MTNKLKIKIIKKGEKKAVSQPVVNDTRSKRQAAREIVSNVTGWVSDIQTRKREETRIAIEKLFNGNPRPSEM